MPALAVAVALTLHAQRRGRRVRRRRAAAAAEGLPAARGAAGRRGRLLRAGARPRSPSASRRSSTLKDPTSRDRVAMLREGEHMIEDHPLARRRPEHGAAALRASTASPDAVNAVNPHLHNVPAADRRRARPAGARRLALVHRRPGRRARRSSCAITRQRLLAAAGLAAVVVDARGRDVRIQLRRLRIPDAVPRSSSRCRSPPPVDDAPNAHGSSIVPDSFSHGPALPVAGSVNGARIVVGHVQSAQWRQWPDGVRRFSVGHGQRLRLSSPARSSSNGVAGGRRTACSE